MPIVVASENKRMSHLVKQELWPEQGYTRAVVTYNGTAGDLLVGRVLGKVTANGKYKIPVEGAADGSLVADAIVIEDRLAVAANTDARVLVLLRGPAVVSRAALILDATINTQAEQDAIVNALEAKGILGNTS